MSLDRTLSFAAVAAISSTACGGDCARSAAITFRCTNPKSRTAWEVKVDCGRGTADSCQAEIAESQIAWRDTLHGGYATHHTCHTG